MLKNVFDKLCNASREKGILWYPARQIASRYNKPSGKTIYFIRESIVLPEQAGLLTYNVSAILPKRLWRSVDFAG